MGAGYGQAKAIIDSKNHPAPTSWVPFYVLPKTQGCALRAYPGLQSKTPFGRLFISHDIILSRSHYLEWLIMQQGRLALQTRCVVEAIFTLIF